jgi:eukaryotic-like serine/threonine-protein kinase
MKRRGFHMLVAFLVAIGLAILSGCGGSGPPSGTTSQTGTATVTPSENVTATSTATPTGVVPPVDGVAVDVAELYIQQAGLKPGPQMQETNSNVTVGFVITSQPPVGQKEPLGTPVELLISDGSAGCQPPGPSCDHSNIIGAMINVIGDSLPMAITSLALSGLTLGVMTVVHSSQPTGTVVCTNPSAGEFFSVEDPISVGVSSGIPGAPATSGCSGLTLSISPTPSPF